MRVPGELRCCYLCGVIMWRDDDFVTEDGDLDLVYVCPVCDCTLMVTGDDYHGFPQH